MRERLIQYVELLFAGARDCEDIKQEILQNTLDRYDDLIAEGKVPEAAYRLAITGIGDINEILGLCPQPIPARQHPESQSLEVDTPEKKRTRAIAVGLYIVSLLPLIVASEFKRDILGLCITVGIVAVATVMMILAAKNDNTVEISTPKQQPETELHRSIRSLVWVMGLAVYFILSFTTGAWYITWLIFPITGAVNSLIKAILDLKEAIEHEN